jgi:putative MATE family efflux protein
MNAPLTLSPPARPAWQALLLLAWPVLLQQWLILAVSLYDRLLAGHGQGEAATLNAQTTAGYLAWFLGSVSVLVNVGSTALVAHLVGGGRRGEAATVLHQSVLLAAAVGLAGAVLMYVGLRPLLGLLQLEGEAATQAVAYLRPLLAVLPLHLVAMAGIACLVGAGDTRTGLFILGGEALLNLPLARLCFGWLGFAGIAVGTALAQAAGALAVLVILAHGRAGLRLEWAKLAIEPSLLRRLLRVSIPAAADTLSMQAGYLAFLGIVNTLGDTAGAAHGIALNWEAMGYQTGHAFGVAAMALVGQAQGAGSPARAMRTGWLAFFMGAAAMSVMGALFFTLARPMFLLFCPYPAQADIVAEGVPVLRLVAFGMPALASCVILSQALRGAGDTRWPMLFTWVGFFGVRLPLAWLMVSWGWGLFGAWVAMNLDMHVRGLCLLGRYASGRWREVRV